MVHTFASTAFVFMHSIAIKFLGFLEENIKYFSICPHQTLMRKNVSQHDVEDDLNAYAYGSPVHTTEAAVNALPVLPAPIHTRTQVLFKVKLFVAFILVVFGFIK